MFERIGITPRQEAIYRLLVDEPQLDRAALGERMDLAPATLDAELSRLQSLGLLRIDPTDRGSLVVSDPEAALSLLVRSQQSELDAMLKESTELAQTLRRHRQASEVSSIMEIITGADAITSRWEHAQKTATQRIRMTDRPPYYAGAQVEGMRIQLERMAEGLPFQTLYDAAILNEPHHLHRTRIAIEAGEDARVLPDVPIKLVLVDDELAFLVLLNSAETREPTVILIYQSALLDSLSELFNQLWSRGVPMPSGDLPELSEDLPTDQRRLIALMASGLKDEAIALEMDLAPRTIRRKVQELYRTLGVRNRFQAGIAIKERGWL